VDRDPALRARVDAERWQGLGNRVVVLNDRLGGERLGLLGEGAPLSIAEFYIRRVEISQRLRAEQGREPFDYERSDEERDLRTAIRELERPQSQADLESEEPGRRADLTAKAERAWRALQGGSAMSMVRPDEVSLDQPATKGKPAVVPGSPPGFNPPPHPVG